MRQGKIVILHVFDDEKFFDSASDFFDSISGIENLYYMYMPDNMAFKFIKKNEKINIITFLSEIYKFFFGSFY
jgi:hypothetical protein